MMADISISALHLINQDVIIADALHSAPILRQEELQVAIFRFARQAISNVLTMDDAKNAREDVREYTAQLVETARAEEVQSMQEAWGVTPDRTESRSVKIARRRLRSLTRQVRNENAARWDKENTAEPAPLRMTNEITILNRRIDILNAARKMQVYPQVPELIPHITTNAELAEFTNGINARQLSSPLDKMLRQNEWERLKGQQTPEQQKETDALADSKDELLQIGGKIVHQIFDTGHIPCIDPMLGGALPAKPTPARHDAEPAFAGKGKFGPSIPVDDAGFEQEVRYRAPNPKRKLRRQRLEGTNGLSRDPEDFWR